MITVVVLSGICTALAVIGIWGKDNSRYFQLDKEKKNNIHFRDYWQIMKHNKPIRMLVIAAASNKFASMVYSNSTVLVMLFGILMNNYPLAGIIGVIVGIPNLGIIYLAEKSNGGIHMVCHCISGGHDVYDVIHRSDKGFTCGN